MAPHGTSPPKLAEALLDRILGPDEREAVRTELAELYRIRLRKNGVGIADQWYRRQVIGFGLRILRYGRRRRPHTPRRGDGTMRKFIYDLNQSVGRLRRAPVFTMVAILTLGVGVGVFTSVFSVVDAVLLEPMPYRSPAQLVWIWRNYSWVDFPKGWLGGPDVVALREQTETFQAVVAFRSRAFNLTFDDGDRPSQITVLQVSHEFFDLLGVPPLIGRGFQPEETLPNASPVVVLGYDLWRTQFGSDPDVVGRRVRVNDALAEVIGVAPNDLHFVQQGSLSEPVSGDAYMNLTVDLASADPGSGFLAGLARVRGGISPDQLEAALARAAEPIDDAFENKGLVLWGEGVKDAVTKGVRPALTAMMGSAAFLVLVLSGNLATLLLGRAALRERELGLRAALGASRQRIVSSVLSESVILGVVGGAVGVALAFAGTAVIVRLAPGNLPRLGEVGMDASVVAVGFVVTLIAALAAGVTPALQALRVNVGGALQEGSARSGETRRGSRVRNGLVTGQVALSLMLLIGAGLVAQAFMSLVRADPGFDPGRTLTFRVSLVPSADAPDFHRDLLERLAALPSVAAVGTANALPLTQATNQTSVAFPGAEGNVGDDDVDKPLIDWFRVSSGYVEAAGLRLLAGRSFESGDHTRAVAIVDDVLARHFFPNGSAVGRRIFLRDTLTIVGVVDQARLYSVHSDDRGQVFVPFTPFPSRLMSYAMRTQADPMNLVGHVRTTVRQIDPTVAMSDFATLDAVVLESLGQQRLSLTLLASFAGGALLLALLGVYGVVSNGVLRRQREIGLRMALGADRGRVIRLVLGQGIRLVGIGAVVGLVGAVATSRLLGSVMFGVDPANVVIYVLVAAGVVSVAVVASYLPARWATHIDPMTALRVE